MKFCHMLVLSVLKCWQQNKIWSSRCWLVEFLAVYKWLLVWITPLFHIRWLSATTTETKFINQLINYLEDKMKIISLTLKPICHVNSFAIYVLVKLSTDEPFDIKHIRSGESEHFSLHLLFFFTILFFNLAIYCLICFSLQNTGDLPIANKFQDVMKILLKKKILIITWTFLYTDRQRSHLCLISSFWQLSDTNLC